MIQLDHTREGVGNLHHLQASSVQKLNILWEKDGGIFQCLSLWIWIQWDQTRHCQLTYIIYYDNLIFTDSDNYDHALSLYAHQKKCLVIVFIILLKIEICDLGNAACYVTKIFVTYRGNVQMASTLAFLMIDRSRCCS